MNYLLTIVAALFLFMGENRANTCDNLGIILYEELQCKPVMDEGSACPKEYNCPENYAVSEEYCNFEGKKIKVGEKLVGGAVCDVGCRCMDNGLSVATIYCAVVDCWEPPIDEEACYKTESVDSCCPVDTNCPEEDAPVPKCLVDGVTYNETQVFYPKNTCKRCVCTKNFKEGQYENSDDCQTPVCAAEVRSSEKIAKNCAAVYYKRTDDEALCCPATWICADEAEDVITPSGDTEHAGLKCQYGEKTLNYKDSFSRNVVGKFGRYRHITCSCELPPFVTCTGPV